jgi:hypothetical protein
MQTISTNFENINNEDLKKKKTVLKNKTSTSEEYEGHQLS